MNDSKGIAIKEGDKVTIEAVVKMVGDGLVQIDVKGKLILTTGDQVTKLPRPNIQDPIKNEPQ